MFQLALPVNFFVLYSQFVSVLWFAFIIHYDHYLSLPPVSHDDTFVVRKDLLNYILPNCPTGSQSCFDV